MNVLLTIPETAKALGLKTTDAVYERISDGRLRAVNLAKPGERSKTRIRSDDLAAYIESCTRPAIKRAS
jgi:excisionase family DNA binding protein